MTKSLLPPLSPLVLDTVDPLKVSLLQAVVEGFADGLLLLTPAGQLLYANRRGYHLCHQMANDWSIRTPPEPIWTLCQYLIESQGKWPDRPIVLSNTLITPAGTLRVRVQWFQFGDPAQDCLMITLEDQAQAAKNSALFEARQFNLTERETEVWLLRKTNYSYEDIAQQLYITTNTVKRHLKSIYAKRKQILEVEGA